MLNVMTEPRSARSLMEEAQAWTHEDLAARWADIKNGRALPDWPQGKAFEYVVIRAFHLEGTTVRWPYLVTYPQKFGTMEQLDGVVYLEHRPFIVESKDLSESAAIEAVAKLRFRLESRPPSTMAVLFSVGSFSLATEVFTQFASPLNVLLWGRSDLDIALPAGAMTEGLRQKLEYAIEYGLPLYPFGGPE